MRLALIVALVGCSIPALAADKIDPRLASAQTAAIVAADALADDKPVAACLAKVLPEATPLTIVPDQATADVVLKVQANIPSAGKRTWAGPMGGSPSAKMSVTTQDGAVLWADGVKYRRGAFTGAWHSSSDVGKSLECGLAAELADALREAMRQARGK